MSRRRPTLIALSFCIALLLTVIPLPEPLPWLRPYWVAMVLIYWNIECPNEVGMGIAFVVGLVVDLTLGSLFGQHALGLVIIAYIVGRFRLRMRFFPLWQQALAVLAVLLNDRLIYAWVHGLTEHGVPDWRICLAPLVATVLWPWVFLALDLTRQRLRTR